MERNAHDEAATEITSLDIVSAPVSPSDGGGFDTEAEFAQQVNLPRTDMNIAL